MSIKGTLETFNLCELLQMLAFNQKEGTLVLEAEGGGRTLFLDSGRLTFLEQDPTITASVARLVRHHKDCTPERLAKALVRHEESGRHLLAVLEEDGILDSERAAVFYREAVLEQLFECQMTSVAGFEFVEGKALLPDGTEGRPILPLLHVESMLLDLARMLDHWNTVAAIVPGAGEIYEGTGIAMDLSEQDNIDGELAALVTPRIDGCRSLAQIAEDTETTNYAVMQIAATLFDGGAIRAVPTDDLMRRAEDLLDRGEAATTVALFQRCIERGDAPLDVRLRLADAYEASGCPAEAAAELDTFAALSSDDDATGVFEALARALRLRDREFTTASRVCDYYLRRRPWLQEYRALAAQALRDLIHGATTSGRPVDAAVRLKGFIDCGDAPEEELVLLADLFAAGGARKEAADALFQRCEGLIATDRTAPARQLLRRALELDPGHADARRRKMELEGVRKRRGHRARIALILLALGGVASAAGVAWFGYQETASTEITDAQKQAARAVKEAEARAVALIDAFEARANKVEAEGLVDKELAEASTVMRAEVRRIMGSTSTILKGYRDAIDDGQAAGQAERHRDNLTRFNQRGSVVGKHAATVVSDLAGRSRHNLSEANQHLTAGRLTPAGIHLRAAWSLSFDEPSARAAATAKLKILKTYVARYEAVHASMREKTAAGDLQGAFAAGVAGLSALLDSDLTHNLEFPVRITSSPAGAEVWLGATDTGLRTPCVLRYSPFAEEPLVRLRLGGRTPVERKLPAFTQMRRNPKSLEGYKPILSAILKHGPRWVAVDPTDRFHALWIGSGMPLVAGDKGQLTYAAAPRDGRLVAGSRLQDSLDGIRMAGRLPGGLEWRVTGHRTLTVRPAGAKPWEQVTAGRIAHPPTVSDGRLIVMDAIGTVYAWHTQDGREAWRVVELGPPTQAPMRSSVGVLIATTSGATYRIDAKDGDFVALAPPARGAALAVPFGDGALVLGGGKGGCRLVDAKGTVRVLGDARPIVTCAPWVESAGVAWIEEGVGVTWVGLVAKKPLRVTGLGTSVSALAGGEGMLFGAGTDEMMRAVRLTTPQNPAWEAPMGGRAQTAPIRQGRGLYVLVDGRLVAFDV